MPGTILVSVLELMDLPFSSPPSSISVKVSMGKREYQTWDKGDFSFPLTTLRDNLFVVVQDSEGNEMSFAGVETKSIVEKGFWDEIFPLEGGGHVHMKLEFVLNEDERNRIRMMRESAMKKKHGVLLDCRTSSVEFATNDDGRKVTSSLCHDISDKNEETSSAIPLSRTVGDAHLSRFNHRDSNEKVEAQSLFDNIPIRAVYSKESPSSLESPELSSFSRRRGSLDKIPSSVKKMISAFESNVAQDIRSEIKPTPAKLQVDKIGLEELCTAKVRGKGKGKLKLVHKELVTEEEKSHEDLIRTSTIETSSTANGMLNELRHQSYNVSGKKDSTCVSAVEDSEAEFSSRCSQSSTIGGASNHELRSVAYYKDMHGSFEGSGAWIFPDQLRRICITTGGKKLMDFLGGFGSKPEVHQKKIKFSIPEKTNDSGGAESEVERRKRTRKVKKSKPESKDVESSTGPVGQAMKIAIMVGFGVLVLLTRQRNNR